MRRSEFILTEDYVELGSDLRILKGSHVSPVSAYYIKKDTLAEILKPHMISPEKLDESIYRICYTAYGFKLIPVANLKEIT